RGSYAKLGEAVFRLHEGEENPDPLRSEEVQDLFEEIRNSLADLTREQRKLAELRRSERWKSGA
ncbi:hypothetical protein ACFLQJ_02020, partial [Calditrichota bacterium]